MTNCVISGTGLFTPSESISNQELVTSFNQYIDQQYSDCDDADRAKRYSSEAFIEKASGIKRRHVMNKSGILDAGRMAPDIAERSNEALSLQAEMAVAAASQALEKAGCSAAEVDLLIVACSNMQRAYPAISIEVQAELGCQGFAYDMNVACSSATFGIANAVSSIEAGLATKVLVVNPEICSGHLAFEDRDCHFIFGDACTAVLLESQESAQDKALFEVLGCKLQTQYSNNIRNNAGFLNRAAPEHRNDRDKLFVQNGRKVFKEVCPMAAQHLTDHAQSLSIATEQVQRLWLHQANLSMNELIAKKFYGRAATADESPVILDEYANTSSAGSVIALHQYHDDLQAGDVGMLCSFGAGYSIGSVVLRKV